MELTSLVAEEFRLNDFQKKALKKLRLKTIEDLFYHFPVRYGDVAKVVHIRDVKAGEQVAIFGTIKNLSTSKGFKSKIAMSKGTLTDDTGSIELVWFHQPYIAKMISEGALIKAEGKVSEKNGKLYMNNPETESVPEMPIAVGNSIFGSGDNHFAYPVYSESRGLTSKWIYHALKKIFRSGILEKIIDPIPEKILKRYNLPTLTTALIWIHTPKKESDSIAARKRFAFEEVFFIQIEKQLERRRHEEYPAFTIEKEEKEIDAFVKRFPFSATRAQTKAIGNILKDFKSGHAMSRLLEGDVGSGKTAVAATTVYAVTTTRPPKTPLKESGQTESQDFGNLQTAYMAPTEILATQHFESFIKYFAYLGIQIGLITGSGCQKFPSKMSPTKATDISRSQLLKWVENGEIPILVGTHALIQKEVKFKNLAYIIIDEQHRFGTNQRAKLRQKDDKLLPHLLSMTATPIPRTLALTVYGDLDLTLLDEMPAGRKQVITEVVLPDKRNDTYEKIRAELQNGRQAYIICPRIDEPDPLKEGALNARSVIEESKRLKKDIFPEYEISILHSKMKPAEKEKVMFDFKEGKTHIMVATSVIEVGVNVPNATSIIIEGAERFGLAQLHQLRGRVIRSNHQAYCYIFTETRSEKTVERLSALTKAKNGFELAEFDLAQRGAGELRGNKQWGITDLGMEAIKNIKMVEAARKEAENIVKEDPLLEQNQTIKNHIQKQEQKIHFE